MKRLSILGSTGSIGRSTLAVVAAHPGRFEVVAISVDPPDTTREHVLKRGYSFTFLSDPNAEAIRRYGVAHEEGGTGGGTLARPAEFLVDAGGIVRWVNLTESYAERARPAQVLEAIGR